MDRLEAFLKGYLMAIDACDKEAKRTEEYYREFYNRKGSDYKRLKDASDVIRAFRFRLDALRAQVIECKKKMLEEDE